MPNEENRDKRTENTDNRPDEAEQPISAEEQQRFSGIFPDTAPTRKKVRQGSFDTDFDPANTQMNRQFSGIFNTGINGNTDVGPDGKNDSGGRDNIGQSTAQVRQRKKAAPKTEFFQKLPLSKPYEIRRLYILLAVFIPFTLFAYFPAIVSLVSTWRHQIDYGHGFFVLPLVVLFLYLRFDTYPGTRSALTWFGLVPLLLCFYMRYVAATHFMDALEQWSILLWIFGIVWFFYGNRVFLWALPSLAYLAFMFPLPYRYEVLLRGKLQEMAAQFAAILLQIMREPAIAIKNTIRIGSHELEVAQACSGIRFLISILAIAFGAVLLMRRPWWQNVLVIAMAVPLAIFVNAARIAMTGILLVHFSDILEKIKPAGQNTGVFADEIAGITMIFVAVGIFFSFIWYIGKVFRQVEI
ncbi:MAG: exosortase/archaeosortase family protein [Planctomycetaceae bacterium]|nr:exosortase/archaeosortase family protein [Planctomycetaceae bacterium]